MGKIRNNSNYLHCFPFPRGGYGGRPKLPIETDVRSIYGKVNVISLPFACFANGLLLGWNKNDPVDLESLRVYAEKQWERSTEKFLGEVDHSEGLSQKIGEWVDHQRGVTIGWSMNESSDLNKHEFCRDLHTSIAILSRCTGDMFIAAREPDYSWETLFGQIFAFDDDLVFPSNERGQ